MLNEFRHLLGERKSAWEQLSKLKKLAEEGEVGEEQFKKLGAEYQARFQAADQQIANFKQGINVKLSVIRPTLDAYDGQLRRIEQERVLAKWTQEQYQERVRKVAEERARYARKERVPYLEALLKAELPEHLDALNPQGAATPARQGVSGLPKLWDLLLRGAGFAIAAGLFLLLFLPFFSVTLGDLAGEGASLAGATISACHVSFLGLLFTGIPLCLALLVGLISLLPGKGLRGTLHLCLAAILCVSAAVFTAVAFYYPHLLLHQVKLMLMDLGHARAGLLLAMALLGGLYLLALLHLLRSKTGLVLWAATVLIALIAAGGAAVFLHQWVNIEYRVSLKNTAQHGEQPALDILVENAGNVPLVVQDLLGKTQPSNQVGLVFEEHSESTGWGPTALGVGMNSDPSSPTLIPPSASLHIPAHPGLPEGLLKTTIRVGLMRSGVPTAYSNDVVITAPAPAPAPVPPSPRPAPQPVPNPNPPAPAPNDLAKAQAEEARKKVDELRVRLASGEVDTMVTSITEARAAINLVSLEKERVKLMSSLDESIMTAKDRQGNGLFQRATESYGNGSYERASQLAKEVLDLYAAEPKTMDDALTQNGQALVENAKGLFKDAQQAADPAQRYVITGIVHKGQDEIVGFLQDSLTQQTFRVSPGDQVNDCTVGKIGDREIELQRGGKTFLLHK